MTSPEDVRLSAMKNFFLESAKPVFLCWSMVLVGVLLVAGCSPMPVTSGPPAARVADAEASSVTADDRWWYARFRLRRLADEPVDSHLDLLIADRIVAPVIARHDPAIGLWRFHRRWPRDATGHQFSFIFFAPPDLAKQVERELASDPLLARLGDDGRLLTFRVDPADPGNATDPAATSDPSWPPAIQREWPEFIMGASRMWLGLVHDEAAKHPELDLYARYAAAEEALDDLWFREANHAFFHHLSALFGYKPVRVLRRDIMTF